MEKKMNEFNPTRKDLLNLDQKIIELKGKKKKTVERKRSIESSLTRLQDQYKDVEYRGERFYEIKSKRSVLKEQASKVELEIININEEIKYKRSLRNEVEFHIKTKGQESKMMLELDKLKRKYSDFAKDKTRVASMRLMASEFRDEIEKLIAI